MIQWHLEKRLIKDLKPHPNNPRQISKDQMRHLATSIERFGLIDKPIINLDNRIIGGHQRVTHLKSEKAKEVECMVPDRILEDKEVDELMIRLNRNHGDFDYDVLANAFDIPCLLDWGFLPDELELSVTDIETDDKPGEPDPKKKTCPNCGHEL
jgi:ParB-like chromosome segregation protein Spo0J